MRYPERVLHFIGGDERGSAAAEWFDKKNPCDGTTLGQVARGRADDAKQCVDLAVLGFEAWSRTPIVTRGEILRRATLLLIEAKEEVAAIVSIETGKSRAAPNQRLGPRIRIVVFRKAIG
jgi:acyl-CoA reductase-like NAD-dependent aldehyde dehydrogenase